MDVLAFTICLASGCISFLVHALLPAMLLPVGHWRGRAYVFGGGGAGDSLNCRVWQQDQREMYFIYAFHEPCRKEKKKTCMISSHAPIEALYSPTLWAWFDNVEGHRCTPLLPLRKSAPPSPSISSTCRRLLALTRTTETTASMYF